MPFAFIRKGQGSGRRRSSAVPDRLSRAGKLSCEDVSPYLRNPRIRCYDAPHWNVSLHAKTGSLELCSAQEQCFPSFPAAGPSFHPIRQPTPTCPSTISQRFLPGNRPFVAHPGRSMACVAPAGTGGGPPSPIRRCIGKLRWPPMSPSIALTPSPDPASGPGRAQQRPIVDRQRLKATPQRRRSTCPAPGLRCNCNGGFLWRRGISAVLIGSPP